jgi:ADP-heptose:LPS heptosyltransferase
VAIAVTGSAHEAALVADVVGRMTAPAVDLAGRLDLSALIGLLDAAEVVVANDTGPLHLAGAVGTPSVGVFWCGNAITAGLPFRRRHRVAVGWQLDCPVCGRNCIRDECSHRESFVADVPVAEVLGAAVDLLEAAGEGGEVAATAAAGP